MKESMEIIESGWNLENTYLSLPKLFFTRLKLNPVSQPKLIILNNLLAKSLGLNLEELESKEGVAVFSGNRVPKGSIPIAQAYAGHQFGHLTVLGDGRAMLIGEQITPSGNRLDIQLKGSGRTPYSRGGDGRAALGPMLREYIISEAMHGLGIPTSRALAVVSTGDFIIREKKLPGGILTRVSTSHLRVGTFQYAANLGSVEDLRILADYTLKRHFPNNNTDENPYVFLLKEVMKAQATLIAKWQQVGFIHGVMNTDNMTISGQTIDYGPCAFMDAYDPNTVFSSIDTYRRYAYGNQPKIGQWNIARFAETLLPLLDDNMDKAVKLANDIIGKFTEIYNYSWLCGMRAKLGLFNEELEDKSLIENLLNMMDKYNSDYTNTFIALTFDKLEKGNLFKSLEFKEWYSLWQARLNRQEESIDLCHKLMRDSNPAVIPRNHRVEAALEAVEKQEDYSLVEELNHILSNPYEHSPQQVEYSKLPDLSTKAYKTFCGT